MKKTFLISGIIILIIALILLKINILKLPASVVRFFSNNITANFNSISSSLNSKTDAFLNTSKLLEENQKLKEENLNLYNKINELSEKIKEDEILENSKEFIKNYNYKFAKVLTIDKENSNTIIINIGYKDGVDIGYPVVFENGYLIGTIKKVSSNTSIVLLTIDKANEISATVSGYDHNIGISTGNYGLNFKLNYVSVKENININDLIVTSGIENNIPAGLIIGKVSKIESTPSDFFQDITVSPLIPFENFRIVSVILPNDDK